MNWPYSNYSKIDQIIKENFPFQKPRPNQLETISEIKKAVEMGYKYIVLEAGTGTGKSAMAATLASIYDSSYILTVTKQLQDQYLEDFKNLGFKLVKGKSNFKCKKYSEDKINETCENGRCALEGYHCEYDVHMGNFKSRSPEMACDYAYQKCVAIDSRVAITNYAFYFLELNNQSSFTKRQLVIFDEAHNIEDVVMNFLNLEFTRNDLKENLGINLSKELINNLLDSDYNVWINFVLRVIRGYNEELDKLKPIKDSSLEVAKKFATLLGLKNDCEMFVKFIREDPTNWIADYDSFTKTLAFKPLKVDKYAKEYLFKHGEICLFMSATILDYKLFAKWLGISEDEIYPIRQKSPFDVARNPIITYDDFPMSYTKLPINAPKTVPAIREILDMHSNDKGLIHTVSYQCKEFLKKQLNSSRLIDHKTYNRARQLKKFKNSKKPLVLISPSMNEGVDLPGDQCRFQIIYKIPYPTLADKQTNLRKRMEQEWYDYKTCLALVQTYGRGMRHEKDYCRTYFIDSRLKSFVRRDEFSNGFLPDSFKRAIDIEPAKIEEDVETPEMEVSESYEDKVNLKYELYVKGRKLLEERRFGDAVDFYRNLLNHELFINDYHPYMKLSQAYRGEEDFESEVDIISQFYTSGRFARPSTVKWFKKRLKQLDGLGFYDFSEYDSLEGEYNRKGRKRRKLSKIPVPLACDIKSVRKKLNENPKSMDNDDSSLQNNVQLKLKLVLTGDDLIESRQYKDAINHFNNLIGHELFVNDYYPYRKLATAYRKDRQFDKEAETIIRFYKSGIYCDRRHYNWFRTRLKKLYEKGHFDFSRFKAIEEEFFQNGYLNQNNINQPVPLAIILKKGEGSFNASKRPRRLKRDNYPKSFERKNSRYNVEYFNSKAKEIQEKQGYLSDNDVMKYVESDFVPFDNFEEINEKAELKEMGKELEREDKSEAIKFYDGLKQHRLFINDYYPYRRQCILFKNKIKDDSSDWKTIEELFTNKIYFNDYQLVWLENKIRELIAKLDLMQHEIDTMWMLVENFKQNRHMYEPRQDMPVPIAERILKDENGVKVISKKKYDQVQELFYKKEFVTGYIRRREFDMAMKSSFELLQSEDLNLQYYVYKQFARIYREMDDPKEFERLYSHFK